VKEGKRRGRFSRRVVAKILQTTMLLKHSRPGDDQTVAAGALRRPSGPDTYGAAPNGGALRARVVGGATPRGVEEVASVASWECAPGLKVVPDLVLNSDPTTRLATKSKRVQTVGGVEKPRGRGF